MELRSHTASVDQLKWSPKEADILATCSADKTVRLWDVRSAIPIESIGTAGENINICWHPAGTFLAVGSKVFTIIYIHFIM